ncbi:MAG: antibiotic biosynthesis monooxygenase [Deltaproteobacteria bacterium]|jgi:heme-degrading monooxygenase HmoA|nr:antibiotic biosynthesis monooxygenase [Deltaproteobacteria bacterium]
MSIEVMIKRKVKQGPQARKVVPLILQLRALATSQPGYISGRTLFNVENPEDCVVVSVWQTLEDWYHWIKNKDREAIQTKIDAETGVPTEYSVYAPMVAPS